MGPEEPWPRPANSRDRRLNEGFAARQRILALEEEVDALRTELRPLIKQMVQPRPPPALRVPSMAQGMGMGCMGSMSVMDSGGPSLGQGMPVASMAPTPAMAMPTLGSMAIAA